MIMSGTTLSKGGVVVTVLPALGCNTNAMRCWLGSLGNLRVMAQVSGTMGPMMVITRGPML